MAAEKLIIGLVSACLLNEQNKFKLQKLVWKFQGRNRRLEKSVVGQLLKDW